MDEAKPFGQLIRLPTASATASVEPLIRQFTTSELMGLPARLDNPTMRALRDFYRSPLPPEPPVSAGFFAECMRTMRACLPSRPADDLDGQLMFAMYSHHLGHFSAGALDYLTKQATRDCRWFPTINECLEMIGEYRRPADGHVQARLMARQIFNREDGHRDEEERAAKLAAETDNLSA